MSPIGRIAAIIVSHRSSVESTIDVPQHTDTSAHHSLMRLDHQPTTVFFVVLLAGSVCIWSAANRRLAGETLDKTTSYKVKLTDPIAPATPAQTYLVVQSRGSNGFPTGYSMALETHVCVDQKCQIVKATLFWDTLGFFERLEYPANAPLTKKEHVPFEAEDYAKLDRVLKERNSVLGSLPVDVLTQPVQDVPGIDGLSAATPQTLKEAVVEGAALTTWSMWHWANGEIVPQLRRLTEQHCTPSFLHHLLQSENRRDVDFSLKYILEHHPSDTQYVNDMFRVLETGDREHILLSLKFLTQAVRDKKRLHADLIRSCSRMNANYSPLVLEYFTAEPDLPAETMEELTGILGQLSYYQVHLILRLLEKKKFSSEKVESNIAGLLDSKDFFIARRAYEYLLRQEVGAETQHKLDTFRDRYRQRL